MAESDKGIATITRLLGDISVRESEECKEEPILGKSDKTSPLIDQKTFELIELVDQYERLMNNEFRLDFINGFLNLSRANFSDGALYKKFGMDTIDLRLCRASKIVRSEEFLTLHDLLDKQASGKKGDDRKSGEKIKHAESVVDEDSLRDEEIKHTESNENEDRNMSEKDGIEDEKGPQKSAPRPKKDDDIPKLKNPVHQFGGLVPYQLRQAQTYFDNALRDSVRSCNIRRKIETLLREIESYHKSQEC